MILKSSLVKLTRYIIVSSSTMNSPRRVLISLIVKFQFQETGYLLRCIPSQRTVSPMFMRAESYHPKSTKEAIAYGQATRLRRICTEETDFWEAADRLRDDLVKRGYKEEQISKEINRAAVKDRNELMTYKERKKNNRTPLVVTFNRRLPKL